MTGMPKFGFIAPMLLLALACSQAGEEQVSMASTEADIEAINQVRDREEAAVSSMEMADLSSVYAADVAFMPPNEPGVMGLEASRSWFAGFHEQFDADLEYTGSDLTVAGDWAIERYTGNVTLTAKAGGESMQETIKGIHVYKRQADGSWLIVQDIWNTDAPMPAGE